MMVIQNDIGNSNTWVAVIEQNIWITIKDHWITFHDWFKVNPVGADYGTLSVKRILRQRQSQRNISKQHLTFHNIMYLTLTIHIDYMEIRTV